MGLWDDYSKTEKFGLGFGGGSLGAGIAGMFGGGSNPADAGRGYLDKIPGAISPYYDPYINAGREMLPKLSGEYGSLVSDPGGKYNQIGQGYQQSPGFQFALQQALQGAGHAAAAGGMAGSPQHEQQNMGIATGLANQDYNNYMQGATGLYGRGLEGEQGINEMGYRASTGMSDQIAQALASQAQLAYAGKAAQNQQQGSMFGNIMQGAGALAAFL